MGEKIKGYSQGPGHTTWFVDADGEVMKALHNDEDRVTRTGLTLHDQSQNNKILALIRQAYEEGMRDQLSMVQNALGMTSDARRTTARY